MSSPMVAFDASIAKASAVRTASGFPISAVPSTRKGVAGTTAPSAGVSMPTENLVPPGKLPEVSRRLVESVGSARWSSPHDDTINKMTAGRQSHFETHPSTMFILLRRLAARRVRGKGTVVGGRLSLVNQA